MADATFESVPLVTPAEKRLNKASSIISSSVGWAAASAAIPLPFVDLAALAAVQGNMINDLCHLYGQTVSKQVVQSVLGVLLGTLVPGGIASAVGSSAKFMPGVGTVMGAVMLAGTGAAATYAIGKVFVKHFEAGGTMENFSPAAVSADLQKEFAASSPKPKPATP
jgi:uncharacterized protein (DUF697 family)